MSKSAKMILAFALIVSFGLGMIMHRNSPVDAAAGIVTVTIQNKYISGNAYVDGAKGRITAPGIDCPGDCSETYTEGQTVTFTRTAEPGWRAEWTASWDCAPGTGAYAATCTKVIKGDQPLYAAGYFYNLGQYWSPDSVSLTIQKTGTGSGTVSGSGFNCGSVCTVTVSMGGSVTLAATPAAGSTFAGWQAGSYCATGYPGGKGGDTSTVNPSANCTINSIFGASATAVAKFDAVPGYTPPATTAPKTNTTPSTTTSPSTPINTAPAAEVTVKADTPPSLNLQINGKAYDEKVSPEFPNGKAVVLSGKTVPNAVIKLYIFSTPREATVTADTAGVWTYTVSGLEEGAHRVEAQVTDPVTKVTSARAKIAAFSVLSAVRTGKTVVSSPAKKSNSIWAVVAVLAVALLALASGVWWFVRKRKQPVMPDQQAPPSVVAS